MAVDFADQRLWRLCRGRHDADHRRERSPAALRRPRARPGWQPRPCGPRRPPRRRRSGQQHRRARPQRTRRCRPTAGRGPRLLQLAPPQPRSPAARVAELGPPRHALGQHRALACRDRRRRAAQQRPPGCRRPRRVDRPAGLVARRPALFRVRPNWLVEPLSCCDSWANSSLPEICRICRAGLDLRRPMVRFSRSGDHSRLLHRGRPLAARADRADNRSADATCRCPIPNSPGSASPGGKCRAARRCGRPPGRDPAARPRERGEPRAALSRDAASRSGLARSARGDRIPERARAERPCLLLPADQSGVRGAGRRAAAADRQEPWRPDRQHLQRAAALDPVLDLARLRGLRRQLRRQHRLRPRLS